MRPYSAYGRLNDIKWVATDIFLGGKILDFVVFGESFLIAYLMGSEVERVYAVSREGVLKKLGVDVPICI